MFTTRAAQLDQFLGDAVQQLDISQADYELAQGRYAEVGSFLADHWADCAAGGCIYPQGSMRLGTVTRMIHRNDEYDLDAVCQRDLAKTSISQASLKEEVGYGLELFVKSEPTGRPWKDEGKRCWTLHYPGQPFHLDILPALPDPQEPPTGIILTDKSLRLWQYSNPISYADWFHFRMKAEWEHKRAVYAESKGMDVDNVPTWSVRTTLQRSVQALKRNRDIFFTDDLDNRTASVIITTLAARAYQGHGGLFEVLSDITKKMPALVEYGNGLYTVSNPVQPKENFADRWARDPHRAKRFFQWMEQAQVDFANVGNNLGFDKVHEATARSLGQQPARQAIDASGAALFNGRKAGRLSIGVGAGTLGLGTRTSYDHTNHGDRPTTPRP